MITLQPIGQALIDSAGKAYQAFYRVLEALVAQQTLDGSGSPEGVLTAPYKAKYWDYANQKLYFKSTPDGNTGWVVLN